MNKIKQNIISRNRGAGFIFGILGKIKQNIADYIRETDKLLLLFCITASLYGCAMVYTTTRYTGNTRQFLVQFLSLLIGISAAIFISLFDYSTISKAIPVYIILSVVLLAVTYKYGYSPDGSDNKAWIKLPFGMSLQVSELIKIFLIIGFSKHVSTIKKQDINKLKSIILLALHGLAPAVAVMVLQKDLGTSIILVFIFLSMIFAAGVKLRYFLFGGALTAILSPFIWFFGLTEYQRLRFSIILDLESDAQGYGYQQLQGLRAVGSGGVLGQGFLQGPKTQAADIPKAYNDFIFASAGEELGFIGCIAIIILIVAIVIRMIRVGALSRDVQGTIITAGAFGMIAAQAIINIGMCLAVLPVIGVTLPFFSAGGTSLVCLYLSVGLVLSVFKNRNKRKIYLRVK